MIVRTYRRRAMIDAVIMMLCIVFVLVFMTQTARADGEPEASLMVDPVKNEENYTAVLYDNTNGLPTSEANAIAETSEGFIWIGSYGGLVRYDGNTFHRIDSSKGLGGVVSLYTDSKDRLWIGTNESGLALMENGSFRFWDEKDGLKGAKVSSIAEDSNGVIYIGTTSEIAMIYPDMTLRKIEDPRLENIYIEHINPGSDNTMHVTTNDDDYFTVRNGKVVSYINHNEAAISNVTAVLPDPDNPSRVYVGTAESQLYNTGVDLVADQSRTVDISPLASVIKMAKIDDKLWLLARNGIGVIDNDGFHYLGDLPMNNSVTEIMADYEGNLWFTSTRQGVMKLVRNRFSDIFDSLGLDDAVVNSTCMLDGRLYIGTDTGLIVTEEDNIIAEVPLSTAQTASGADTGIYDLISMLDGNRIRSIIRDSKNRLWISTWRGVGLVCYDHGRATVYTEDDGLISSHIRTVCEAADGSVLVVLNGGMSVISDGQVVRSYNKEDGIDNPETLCICTAPNGDILLGSNGGGIYVINAERVRCIKDELPSGIVMRIKYDSKRNLFWLVNSNAIAYMTEDYTVTEVRNFPYSNNFDMYENNDGDMWILSSNGIYIAPTEELIGNKHINAAYYGIANGLPCITTSNSYSELTDDGELYIAGGSGVIGVNINESMELINALKMSVPFIEGDGEIYYPDNNGNFVIPSSVKRLTVYGFVYNYSLSDPLVSYRMIGFDTNYVTVNRSDLEPVTFTNLKGGTYRFEMILNDEMGNGSNEIKVMITKKKAIHEQGWFYLLLGVIAAGLIFIFDRLITNHRIQVMEEKHKESAERERIANELNLAARIQSSMLPDASSAFPGRDEFAISALMEPAREVGGDFYDFYMIDDDHLCIVIADVSDKGIPAALFMMVSKAILKSFASMGQSAADVMKNTNDTLSSGNRTEMFVTVWLGILELSSGRLVAANAGHEYPLLKKAGGIYEVIKDKHGLVVGAFEDIVYKEYQLGLVPGDKLFLYTDGIPEAANKDGDMFGMNRMVDALNQDAEAEPNELLKTVHKAIDAFVGDGVQFDDLTMLCLEYKGNGYRD